jgi:hypothetical protein
VSVRADARDFKNRAWRPYNEEVASLLGCRLLVSTVLRQKRPWRPFSRIQWFSAVLTFRILLFEGYIASGGASAAESPDLQPGDTDCEAGLPGNLGFELIEHGTRKLLDSTAAKTRQMNVVASGLYFVVMFFTLQMHQIELVDESKSLEEFNGSIHRRAVDVRFASFRKFQQGRGIEMPVGVLNDLYKDAALRRQAHSLRGEFVQQGPALKGAIWIARSICDRVANMVMTIGFSCDIVAISR